jgi:hypothetical protein
MQIINSRKDFEALSLQEQEQFKAGLAASITHWSWEAGAWVLTQQTGTLEKFGFSLEDFPDAPVPPMPDYNPDEVALENARAAARLTPAKFRLGLLAMDELDSVEAMMANPDTPRDMKIMWEYSSEFERMHPALLQMAAVMGYTDEQMDALFGIEA